jgi:hypothetical protein
MSSEWTSVGKGGRPVSFPAEAASAFGSKPRGGGSGGRAEFSSEAAGAFRRGERRDHGRAAAVAFDATAAAAFGSKPRRAARPEFVEEEGEAVFSKPSRAAESSGFDGAAAAAFGGGNRKRRDDAAGGSRGDFPDAFGKKKSVFAAAGEMGIGEETSSASAGGGSYTLSAFARKRNDAARPGPPKKQTYEEMFPTLGGAAAKPVAAVSAPALAPAPAPASATAGRPTLAQLMRARLAEEEAEAARQAFQEEERHKRMYVEQLERTRLRRLHAARYASAAYTGADYEDDGEEETAPHGSNDLDYNVYGEYHSAYVALPPEETRDESGHDDHEEERDGEDAF